MAYGKAAGQGIVSVEDQLRVGVDGGEDGVKYAFRVAVPGQLIPVQLVMTNSVGWKYLKLWAA